MVRVNTLDTTLMDCVMMSHSFGSVALIPSRKPFWVTMACISSTVRCSRRYACTSWGILLMVASFLI